MTPPRRDSSISAASTGVGVPSRFSSDRVIRVWSPPVKYAAVERRTSATRSGLDARASAFSGRRSAVAIWSPGTP